MDHNFFPNPGNRYVKCTTVALAMVFGLNSGSLLAQQIDPAELPVQSVKLAISEINISGSNPFSPQHTESILSQFLGVDKGLDALQQASSALLAALRKSGYSFYRVSIPSQELTGGVFTLHVDKLELGEISITGNQLYSNDNILATVPILKAGQSPNTRKLSKALTLANYNPGKQTKVTFAKSASIGKIDAIVKVRELDTVNTTVSLNNTGNSDTGRYRISAGFQHNNLLDKDHVGSLSVTTSENGFSEVEQIGATYQVPIYKAGGMLTGYVVSSNIDTGIVADAFDVSGSGEILGLRYMQLLPNYGNAKQQLSVQITDKLFDNNIDFSGVPIGVDVRSRPFGIRYQNQYAKNAWAMDSYLEFLTNISGGNNNDAASYDATRNGATTDWTVAIAGTDISYQTNNWLYQGKLMLFDSSDRLITGEQFGVGGIRSGRGFEERELRGDKGYYAGLQIWLPVKIKNFRAGGFLDYAKVKNNAPIEQEFSSDSITSTGINMIWQYRKSAAIEFHYGYVIDGIGSIPSGSQEGDSRVHFSLSYKW